MGRLKDEWRKAVATYAKAKMKKAGVTYVEVVDRLKAHGFEESKGSLTIKLKRGLRRRIPYGLHCGSGFRWFKS